jgi:hypothetical protein
MCGSSVKATCLIPLRKHPKTFPWLPPPPWGFDHSCVRHNLWSHQLYVIEVIIRYQDAFTVQRQQTVHHQFLFFWTFQNYEHFYNSKGTFLLSLPKTFVEWWLSNFKDWWKRRQHHFYDYAIIQKFFRFENNCLNCYSPKMVAASQIIFFFSDFLFRFFTFFIFIILERSLKWCDTIKFR